MEESATGQEYKRKAGYNYQPEFNFHIHGFFANILQNHK